jgi:hypothetical protein
LWIFAYAKLKFCPKNKYMLFEIQRKLINFLMGTCWGSQDSICGLWILFFKCIEKGSNRLYICLDHGLITIFVY